MSTSKKKVVIDDSGRRTKLPGEAGFYWAQFPGDDYAAPVFWDPGSETIQFIGDGKVWMINKVGKITISHAMIPRMTIKGRYEYAD